MKMTFRWYGETDSIPLEYIRQIPNMSGVVTAVYDTPVGEVWEPEKISRLKYLCDRAGLEMEVIESVPVHEDIKLGKPSRDRLIANYAQTIRNLGKAGVKCICYNFMPVFDWFRTDLCYCQENGSTCLAYKEEDFKKLDKHNLRLPGWDESYTPEELNGLLKEYEGMTHEQLFENLVYFLNGIMPACDETGINMAIHPDDRFVSFRMRSHGTCVSVTGRPLALLTRPIICASKGAPENCRDAYPISLRRSAVARKSCSVAICLRREYRLMPTFIWHIPPRRRDSRTAPARPLWRRPPRQTPRRGCDRRIYVSFRCDRCPHTPRTAQGAARR